MTTTKFERPRLIIDRELSQGQRHRLIGNHTHLVESIAAEFRGAKGIPFEDMLAQGMCGLVEAAHNAERAREFETFAAACIRNAIRRQIKEWQSLSGPIDPDNDNTREYWEWSIWSYAAPYEQWTTLAATPEEIIAEFDELNSVRSAFESAMIGLDNMTRGVMRARFFREPQQELKSIAREYNISYAKTVWIISRALKKIREKLESSRRKTA